MLRRTAAGVLLTVFVLLVAAAATSVWLLASESGGRYIVARLVDATGEVLTAETVDGSVVGGFRFANLDFEIARVRARADEATMQIDVRALLAGRVVVRDLFVSTVTVTPKPVPDAPASDDPFVAPVLPVDLVFESVAIAGVDVVDGDDVLEFGQLTLTASYIGKRLDLARFESSYQAFSFSTQASFELAERPRVDAAISLSGRLADYAVLLGAQVAGTLPEVSVDAELLEPARVNASGPVVLDEGPRFDLDVDWTAIDDESLLALLPIALGPGSGTGRVSGRPDDIDFEVDTSVQVAAGPDTGRAADASPDAGRDLDTGRVAGTASVTIRAAGNLQPDRLQLSTARLTRDGGVAELSGSLDLGTLQFDASLDGSDLDPGWFVPGWAGRVAATARIDGRLSEDWTVASDDLIASGIVRDREFELAAAAQYSAAGDLRLDRGLLQLGANRIVVSGRVGSELDLDVDAELPDIAELADGIAGRLQARVTAAGTLEAAVISGEVDGAGLTFGGASADVARLSGSLGLGAGAPMNLTLAASGAAVGDFGPATIGARVEGTADAHRAELEIDHQSFQAAATLSGSATTTPSWQGRIDQARYQQSPLGVWALREPADLALGSATLSVSTACLGQAAAELCVGVTLGTDDNDRLRVAASDFDLALLQPFLPADVTLVGGLQADIDVTGSRSNPVGNWQVSGDGARLSYAPAGAEPVHLDFQGLEADGRVDLNGFESSVELRGDGSDAFNLQLAGSRTDADRVAIDGRLDGTWSELGALSILSPEVGAIAGHLDVAVGIGGTLDEPSLDGRADLSEGSVALPIWGVVVDSIAGSAASASGETIDFEATGLIDGSELRLGGTTELIAARGWPTRLVLSGERLALVQTADAEVLVSPELEVDVDLPAVRVAGIVTVPEARISIAELPAQAVSPSGDAIVYGEEPEEAESPLEIDADIELVLGDDVRYVGSGLSADLGGGLRLRYSSGTSADASGRLDVEGIYEAFGQELTLERSQLIFTGALTNPTLAVRAVRRVDEVTVGIDLTGTLEAPVSRVFSEPVMAEADAVSYLVFGRPLAVADGAGDPDQLRNAAVALGLRQAVPVIDRIGDSLGLDEFAIESTDMDAGALMAGKYLSPKLYIRYSYGLFNRIGGLLLQYQINNRISVETRSGDQKSMDLIYSIEKD